MIFERTVLDCASLPEDWNFQYGIRDKNRDQLISKNANPWSLWNATSERALTIFMLGRLDEWTQSTGRLIESPRSTGAGNRWSQYAFSRMSMGVHRFENIPKQTPFRTLVAETLKIDPEAARTSLMLLEVPLYNAELNEGNPITSFAFGHKTYNTAPRIDAVVFVPSEKTILFIESKLLAGQQDDQIMRILQAAFLLTQHPDSQFKRAGWNFHFVLLCPAINSGRKTTYDSFVKSPGEFISDQCAHMKASGGVGGTQQDLFDSFSNVAVTKASCWHWSDLMKRLEQSGWNREEYHQSLRKKFGAPLSDASINRFKSAGIGGPLLT